MMDDLVDMAYTFEKYKDYLWGMTLRILVATRAINFRIIPFIMLLLVTRV